MTCQPAREGMAGREGGRETATGVGRGAFQGRSGTGGRPHYGSGA